MKKDHKQTETVQEFSSVSKKTKKDIDYSILNTGPLSLDPKYVELGYRYLWPTNRPGEIEYYQRLGYEVVHDLEAENAAFGPPGKSSPLGTAVTIQSKCGVTHVLMKIPEELGQKLDKFRKNLNDQQRASLGHVDGIPAHHLSGSIDIKDQ